MDACTAGSAALTRRLGERADSTRRRCGAGGERCKKDGSSQDTAISDGGNSASKAWMRLGRWRIMRLPARRPGERAVAERGVCSRR